MWGVWKHIHHYRAFNPITFLCQYLGIPSLGGGVTRNIYNFLCFEFV